MLHIISEANRRVLDADELSQFVDAGKIEIADKDFYERNMAKDGVSPVMFDTWEAKLKLKSKDTSVDFANEIDGAMSIILENYQDEINFIDDEDLKDLLNKRLSYSQIAKLKNGGVKKYLEFRLPPNGARTPNHTEIKFNEKESFSEKQNAGQMGE